VRVCREGAVWHPEGAPDLRALEDEEKYNQMKRGKSEFGKET